MLRSPDGFVGGRTFIELVSGVDLHATLLDLAGVVPSPALHGRSIAPLLTGDPFVAREWIFSEESTYEADTRRCVRTRGHKLIRNFRPGPTLFLPEDLEFSLIRRDMGNHHLGPRREYELYNLSDDPLERNNLAGSPRKGSASTRRLPGPNAPDSSPRTAPSRKAGGSSTIGRIDERKRRPHRRKVAPWYCEASRHLRRQHGAMSAGSSSRLNHRESEISSD